MEVFHVPFSSSLQKGRFANYLGTRFIIDSVSDSKKLQGLELICSKTDEASLVDQVSTYRDFLRKLAL